MEATVGSEAGYVKRALASSLALGALFLAVACGSGGPDDGTSSGSSSGGASGGPGGSSSGATSSGGTSSGGGSSGTDTCEAICSTYALLAFEVPDGVTNLVGATFQVCRGTDCPQGTLTRQDAGGGYSLTFSTPASGGSLTARVVERTAGALSFEIRWDIGEGSTSAALAVEGETFAVTAWHGGDGANSLEKTFTASYVEATMCNSTCKVYDPTR
jgi:hypothetical protein